MHLFAVHHHLHSSIHHIPTMTMNYQPLSDSVGIKLRSRLFCRNSDNDQLMTPINSIFPLSSAMYCRWTSWYNRPLALTELSTNSLTFWVRHLQRLRPHSPVVLHPLALRPPPTGTRTMTGNNNCDRSGKWYPRYVEGCCEYSIRTTIFIL